MTPVTVSTIGFTNTTAQHFFDRLRIADVKLVIDVRLHNTSQLAGFAKAADLGFFLKEITRTKYVHMPLLAPTDEILTAYKKKRMSWALYEIEFLKLMNSRHVEAQIKPEALDGACLLCSESKPHQCHRRLVCDYLNAKWGGALSVTHL